MSALQRTASVMAYSINDMQDLKFNPEALKAGDLSQLDSWVTGNDPSIYIKWIPDELNERDAKRLFSEFGPVSRIEVVPKMKEGRKIGRMMFVHFEQFYDHSYENFARQVANMHPEPVPVEYVAPNKNGYPKKYELKCCINMRPIPKVEYSASQLSDMFERLNTRTTATLDAMRQEIEKLKEENHFLRTEIQTHKALISMMPMKIEQLHIITSEPAAAAAASVEHLMNK